MYYQLTSVLLSGHCEQICSVASKSLANTTLSKCAWSHLCQFKICLAKENYLLCCVYHSAVFIAKHICTCVTVQLQTFSAKHTYLNSNGSCPAEEQSLVSRNNAHEHQISVVQVISWMYRQVKKTKGKKQNKKDWTGKQRLNQKR